MASKVNIGDFRHRVTFQKPIKVDDEYKGHTITYQDVITVWAQIDPISGREYFYAHQIQNEVSHRIRIRYAMEINEEMRIVYGERIFEIETILDKNERKEFLEILCQEAK